MSGSSDDAMTVARAQTRIVAAVAVLADADFRVVWEVEQDVDGVIAAVFAVVRAHAYASRRRAEVKEVQLEHEAPKYRHSLH